MNVKVTEANDMSHDELEELRMHSVRKIGEWVRKNANPFTPTKQLLEKGVTTKAFLKIHHVCMKCGDVQEIAAYAIAQNAMGHKVNYTCDCGHVTVLPQV